MYETCNICLKLFRRGRRQLFIIDVFLRESCAKYVVRYSHYFEFDQNGIRMTQNHPLAKWVYKFLPSQKLVHLSGYFKHHIGVSQLPKNRCEIL